MKEITGTVHWPILLYMLIITALQHYFDDLCMQPSFLSGHLVVTLVTTCDIAGAFDGSIRQQGHCRIHPTAPVASFSSLTHLWIFSLSFSILVFNSF